MVGICRRSAGAGAERKRLEKEQISMKMKKFGGTERVVYDLVKPIADEFGYTIWDVCFEKEGALLVPSGIH